MSALQYAAGYCMIGTALWLAIQAVVVRGDYGWMFRPWWNRMLMFVAAICLTNRGLVTVHNDIKLTVAGVCLAFSMCAWQLGELRRMVRESWRRKEDMEQVGRVIAEEFPDAAVPAYEPQPVRRRPF